MLTIKLNIDDDSYKLHTNQIKAVKDIAQGISLWLQQ